MVKKRNLAISELAGVLYKRTKYKGQPKSIRNGWRFIPNCHSFRITRGPVDEMLTNLGIYIRNSENDVIEMEKFLNAPLNNYMKFQIKRLTLSKDDPQKFWELAFHLMSSSKAFQIAALNKVLKGWETFLPVWIAEKLIKQVGLLFKNREFAVEYHRVYIDDGKKTDRPLGVPTLKWRVALHMLNNMVWIFIKDKMIENQHGFVPGKGTLTAWQALLPNLLRKKFVKETDLRSFFPSVNIDYLSFHLLVNLKFPSDVVAWLTKLNRTLPIFPKETKDFDELLVEGRKKLKDLDLESSETSKSEKSIRAEAFLKHLTGLPQGAPTSPLLSISILDKFLTQKPSVAYADDQVFFDDSDFTLKEEVYKGIMIHPDKSHWIKREGKWLKPIKFLGIVFDPFKDEIRAETRKGSRLVLNAELRDKILNSGSTLIAKDYLQHPWERLFQSPIMGYLWAGLYTGSFHLEDPPYPEPNKYSKGSWCLLHFDASINSMYNRSSYACNFLANSFSKPWRNKGFYSLKLNSSPSYVKMEKKSTVSNEAIMTDNAKLKSLKHMVASQEQKSPHTADFDFFDTIEPVKTLKGSGLSGKGDPWNDFDNTSKLIDMVGFLSRATTAEMKIYLRNMFFDLGPSSNSLNRLDCMNKAFFHQTWLMDRWWSHWMWRISRMWKQPSYYLSRWFSPPLWNPSRPFFPKIFNFSLRWRELFYTNKNGSGVGELWRRRFLGQGAKSLERLDTSRLAAGPQGRLDGTKDSVETSVENRLTENRSVEDTGPVLINWGAGGRLEPQLENPIIRYKRKLEDWIHSYAYPKLQGRSCENSIENQENAHISKRMLTRISMEEKQLDKPNILVTILQYFWIVICWIIFLFALTVLASLSKNLYLDLKPKILSGLSDSIAEVKDSTTDWITLVLLIIIAILIGVALYNYMIPKTVKISDNLNLERIKTLEERNADLANQLNDLVNHKNDTISKVSELTESLRLKGKEIVDLHSSSEQQSTLIESLKLKLESYSQTLITVREENLSLINSSSLADKTIIQVNKLLEDAQTELSHITSQFHQLAESVHSSGHVSSALKIEEYFNNLECPALSTLEQLRKVVDPSKCVETWTNYLEHQATTQLSDKYIEDMIKVFEILSDFFASTNITQLVM